MKNVIYAGMRNPGRDQAIHEALKCKSAPEVAEQFGCSAGTVRAAGKRIAALSTFALTLAGGGKDIPVGLVAARSFRRAALGAYRHYCGTFRNLELPTWVLTDGTNRIAITELRDIDAGVISVEDAE
ncbi:hypothetical protein [Pseudomonas fluvialis]|uniref:hypothetical protein n=1 Tax=Pseudomonas fluvialis TaxID=1793966 RepID=UPI0035AE5CB6